MKDTLTAAAGGGFSPGDPAGLAAALAGLALLVAVGALSRAGKHAFSASMVYLAAGALAAIGLALAGVAPIDPLKHHNLVAHVTEAGMTVALFGTGLRLRRPLRLRAWGSPLRLLLIALPLTVAAVAAWGRAVMGLSLGAAVALAAALAPTDPVLAGGIGVRPPWKRAESREPRFALSGEAGANDGLGLPFLVLGLDLSDRSGSGWIGQWIGVDVAYGIAGGLAVGAAVGYAIGAASARLRDQHRLAPELDGWVGVATAFLAYGAAQLFDTYGFLAAFAAGLAFRRRDPEPGGNRGVHAGSENAANLGELAILLLVGTMLTLDGLGKPGIAGWAVAPVLLVVVRPLAVMISLARSPMTAAERGYVAWFGVRGVASLNYAALVAAAGGLSGAERTTVVWTIIAVVTTSIALHGASATPLARRLL